VRSSFEEFIETNLMVQSKFNLGFWFVSYNIFFCYEKSEARHCHLSPPSSLPLSHAISSCCSKYSGYNVFTVMFRASGAAWFCVISSAIVLPDAYSVTSAVHQYHGSMHVLSPSTNVGRTPYVVTNYYSFRQK
jgi:hypothetical protein